MRLYPAVYEFMVSMEWFFGIDLYHIYTRYPLVNVDIAIENGLPMDSMVIYHQFCVCLPEGKSPLIPINYH